MEDLRPAPQRVRRTTKDQRVRVRRSIETFGRVRPVLIRCSGEIVDGPIVVDALRELGTKTVPRLVIDHLPIPGIRLLAIALNRIRETGEWDDENPRVGFVELEELEVDLTLTGFEMPEIDFHLGNFLFRRTDLTHWTI